MNKPEIYNSSIIDELFDEIPVEDFERTEKKMVLAAKIADAIKAKGWKKSELAKRLGKQPSEISKWLSGTHNFTTDTLFDLEKELDINLINVESKEVRSTVKFHVEITTRAKVEYPLGAYPLMPGRKKVRRHHLTGSESLLNFSKTIALA